MASVQRKDEHMAAGKRERRAVAPEHLRRRVDPDRLRFESTAEVEPLLGTVGQPRAVDAIVYGLEVGTRGFNLFASGPPGSGRLSTVLDYVRSMATDKPAPDDWVYVHNFASPDRPNAIRLPAGRGRELAGALEEFVESAEREIRHAFESEEYGRRQREILGEATRKQGELVKDLEQFARERGVGVHVTATGITTLPLVDDAPITREDFDKLPQEQRDRIETAGREVEERAATYIHKLHRLEKETEARVQELDHEVGLYATGPLFRDLQERFAGQAEVLDHLSAVHEDVLAHLSEFRGDQQPQMVLGLGPRDERSRFGVNVLVDNADAVGAPVVVEPNPTYYNLLGRVEYRATFGAMVTDFKEIKAGALHRANGGFVVLDALELLRHPFSWDALKRALAGGEIRIENLGEEFSAIPSATLRPEPIPLDVKVVLLGPPAVYRLLYALDEDFRDLFKVKADFSPELDWDAEHERAYAAFVSRWVREHDLLHFDRGAVARLIEFGARLRDDQRKLSARLIEVADLVAEASFWAGRAGHELVEARDVDLAVRKKEFRSNLLEERVRELIDRHVIVIDTDGGRVGEVNGIAVLDLGDHAFGRPTRVSARVSLGRGGVASIEREIELSGPIHSKGVMILTGYLDAMYAQELPLALGASLTFEQSYDEVEGDSASSTELYALLSALSGLPIEQGIAVTGSVDQHGRVQAVGGVTRKVEGFYAVCKARGLTGRQGVVIPAANVANLMLDDEVVEAVRQGRFHVWAVDTVDEGIELLTGVPAGRRRADGSFRSGTVHALAAERLRGYAEAYSRFVSMDDDRR